MVYFTALFPYVILIALLINNTQLPGASGGISFFIVPEWDRLLSVEVSSSSGGLFVIGMVMVLSPFWTRCRCG